MSAPPRFDGPPATTIDEVIRDLEAIVDWSYQAESRCGYFAQVYLATTRNILAGLQAGEFQNPELLAHLDVVFANRYIDAFDAYHRGRPLTRSWRIAFDTDQRHALIILQHVLLGMNAHINLDLGVAAAEVAPGPAIEGLQADFNTVNDILGRLVDRVEGALGQTMPLLAVADHLAGDVDERTIFFSIRAARKAAWRSALGLAAAPPAEVPARIDALDDAVAGLAGLVAGNRLTRILAAPLRVFDRRKPRDILDILRTI